jgi:hypothetical protein
VLTPSPPTNSNELAGIPPQASTPLQSFTRTPRRPTLSRPANRPTNPCPLLPRFLSPSASCQPCGATYLRRVPNPPVTLRPQGFAPSRRFAPHTTCRACFIPVPLLGFTPRGLVPRATPYAVSSAGPLLGFPPVSEESGRPSRGSTRHAKPDHASRGLAGPSLRCLHELHSLRGFLPPAIAGLVNPTSPLACFLGCRSSR